MNAQAIESRRAERERIARLTEAFLANGGEIKQAPPSQYSHDPLPLRLDSAANGWDNRERSDD